MRSRRQTLRLSGHIAPGAAVEVGLLQDVDHLLRHHIELGEDEGQVGDVLGLRHDGNGHCTELSYLVKCVQNPETLRLLNWEKAASVLEEEDGGVTTATVAERILSEASWGFTCYVEWWIEKCAKEGKPANLPPSKIIGIYRNQLAIAMQELNMGTRRHLTATFWQRVRRGAAWVRTRQTADLPPALS
jgi:hypothetical protein